MTTLADFDPKELSEAAALVSFISAAYFNLHRNTSYSKKHRDELLRNRQRIEKLIEFASLNIEELYG